jgi:hypothetical protein
LNLQVHHNIHKSLVFYHIQSHLNPYRVIRLLFFFLHKALFTWTFAKSSVYSINELIYWNALYYLYCWLFNNINCVINEHHARREMRNEQELLGTMNRLLSFNTTRSAWKTKKLGVGHRHTDNNAIS